MIKHVGQVINTGRRCVVVFREIYDNNGKVVDPNNCLVVETDTLPDAVHQDLIRIVESEPAQRDGDLFNVLARERLNDGSLALAYFHQSGRLRKYPTSQVMLIPDSNNTLRLDKMNTILRMQKEGKSQDEISVAISDNNAVTTAPEPAATINEAATVPPADDSGVLSDEQIALAKFNNAKQLMAEAERLLAEAYELDASLKPRRGRPPTRKS